MDIGISGMFGNSPRRDMGFLRAYAQTCEGLGFASLWAPEHVVFFASYDSKYPYTEDGSQPWSPDTGIYDCLTVCTVAATVTTRLRVCTSVMILPQRPALLTAKEALSVDHASNGRFVLGVGAGWSSEEYLALGVPWEDRARRYDECIEAMRVAWTEDRATYRGRYVNFENAVLNPKPVNGTIPIVIGGDSGVAIRRAARIGDGWYGWWAGYDLDAQVERMHAALEAHGRTGDANFSWKLGLPIGGESPDEVAAKAAKAESLGIGEFVVGAPVPTKDFETHLQRWADALGVRAPA